MCGFAVAVDVAGGGRARPWALHLLRHRGPDGEGTLRDPAGNVALEHCRLAIIDSANPDADQPFSDPSGRWTIVYNGEIFNFRELRAELERRGVRFRTESDTETLLHAFIEDGEAILERLRGMFAFAVWDDETGELFAARDQIGVKPLYYRLDDGIFTAASEVRPLLTSHASPARLDDAGVIELLAFGNNVDERTVVEGVRRLLPGHRLRLRDGRLDVREYWDALPPEPEPLGGDLADALLSRLEEAVARSLVGDVPLGVMLSGGVDSSAVAALAARQVAPSELTAYSVVFGRPDDEAAAAARLARDLGLRHRTISVTEHDLRADFDRWLDELDYPAGNPTWIASSFIAEAARADGIKVLLTGDGGDELFGGYTRWMKYLRFHDRVWARVPPPVRRVAGAAAAPLAPGLSGDIARRAASGGDLFVPSRPFHDDLLGRCLGPVGRPLLARFPPEAGIGALRRRFDERLPRSDYLAWMSYASLKTHLVEDYLQRLDKMGMRHSVEGRVPLLDPELVRFAFGVPQALKVPRFEQKALLRRAVAPVVPGYVLERPKRGFCAPVAAWAEEVLLARPLLEDGPLAEGGVLDPRAASALLARPGRHSFAAWTLGILAEWTRRNLEPRPVHALKAVA